MFSSRPVAYETSFTDKSICKVYFNCFSLLQIAISFIIAQRYIKSTKFIDTMKFNISSKINSPYKKNEYPLRRAPVFTIYNYLDLKHIPATDKEPGRLSL